MQFDAQRCWRICKEALIEKRNPDAIRPPHIRWYPKVKLQVAPLRYPGFPVQLSGVGELHAESRIRGLVRYRDAGNPGSASVPRQAGTGGMTNLKAVAHLGMGGDGWTESKGQV